jgi:enediyne biosynthesis protein E4
MATRGVRPTPRGKPSGRPFPVRFTDVAADSGLTQRLICGRDDRKDYIIETIGCGAVFFDYDNDGWLDIFLPSGTVLEGEPPPGTGNRLYKNNRDGTFTDVTESSGLAHTGWAHGVAVGDYNNDGFEDLFISYWGQNLLYRNNGDGTFTDVTRDAGLIQTERHWSTGCTFLDYNNDGHLDIFVATYLDFDPNRVAKPGGTPYCNWKGVPVNCGPRGLVRGRCFLYRNDGKGHFTDVSEQAGISKARGYCLTAVSADFSDNGAPDIFVACDSTPSLLFRNNRNGTFTEMGIEAGVAVNEDGQEQAGMGVAVGDFQPDGRIDLFKTHFADDSPILYRNTGKTFFQDVTIRSGLGVETRYICWGAGITDLDNDGLPDIFFVTGSVYPEIEATVPAYAYRTPRVLFRNLGEGKFEELFDEAGPAITAAHSSRGCAFGDFDNDGDVDMLIMNLNEPPSLLRNDCSSGHHWVKLLLEGTKSNRSAIGARVTVRYGERTQVQEVMSQSSFLSCSDRRLHFGLGAIDHVSVSIRWPSGAEQSFAKLPAGRLHVINETRGVVRSVEFPLRSKM